jgi:MoxR-like ATPase
MEAENLIGSWMQGNATLSAKGTLTISPPIPSGPASKLRLAYEWIATKAILTSQGDICSISPRYIGRSQVRVDLSDGQAYSSFILLPLLNLATSRRMVFVGAPGRGKTSVATLMSLITGASLETTRRQIQHGHPQMTVHDLLGSPLPSNLMKADLATEVRLDWRSWLTARVKIIDEYNRIPTKTQSALLSLLAEGYAEMFEQTIEVGASAWFLTANDELGGGTFPVIEALKDRIDAVVRCAPFQQEHIDTLVQRISTGDLPESHIPSDIIFSADELKQLDEEVREVSVPSELLDLVGFVIGQMEFCRRASDRIDYMNKDTLHLAGRRVGHVCNEDCPLDRQASLCAQTENGVSPRSMQALIHFAKALAYFFGRQEVELNDVRQLLPWILFDRLRPNLQSPYFERDEHKVLLHDRATWIQTIFDIGVQQYATYQPIRDGVSACIATATDNEQPITTRLAVIERQIAKLADECELNGAVHADILRLRRIHAELRGKLPTIGR